MALFSSLFADLTLPDTHQYTAEVLGSADVAGEGKPRRNVACPAETAYRIAKTGTADLNIGKYIVNLGTTELSTGKHKVNIGTAELNTGI